MLTELSKVNAPSMLLEDFNYFFNKAIRQYINKRYNIYDVNQQTTDDLRVLKATTILTPTLSTNFAPLSDLSSLGAGKSKLFGATYEVQMPQDYMHLLNCICIYSLAKDYKCYNKGDEVPFAAKRLTADSWSVVMNDYYNRPLPQRPYYYIHNINLQEKLSTNPVRDVTAANVEGTSKTISLGTDVTGPYEVASDGKTTSVNGKSNFPRTISVEGFTEAPSVVEREIGVRYGNPSTVRLEIRYGHDNTIFQLKKVFIDYIKTPQTIRLTQEQVNLTEDTSQIMEFPDYVCQEIINELTHLVQENTADPRLQTHPVITQSIANPAQAQAQPQPTAKAQRAE